MEYQAQSKAVLDQLCRERSIPCRGKTKEELLQALVDYDMQQAVQNDASNTAEEIPAAFVNDVPRSGDPLDLYLQTVLKYVDSADTNQKLQLILKYQREREAAERQAEREAAERQAAREHELKMAELERLTASPISINSRDSSAPKPRAENFPTLDKDGDLDVFLRSFEKVCRQYQLPKDQWAKYLTPGLRGPALEAFAALPAEFDQDYDSIKAALQERYNLTPEVYRNKFRTLQKHPTESYAAVVGHLATAFRQWTAGLEITTVEGLQDLLIKEQFLQLCPADVQEWLLDRNPKTALEAGKLADVHTANRATVDRSRGFAKGTSNWRTTPPRLPITRPSGPSFVSAPTSGRGGASAIATQGDSRRCFICNQVGHISVACPGKRQPALSAGEGRSSEPTPSVLFVTRSEGSNNVNLQPVTVGGEVTVGLRDTGADVTLVRPELVGSEDLIPGKTLAVKGIGGIRLVVPMARVYLDWGAGKGFRNVGVDENIPANVLLGTDLGRLLSQYVPEGVSKVSCDNVQEENSRDRGLNEYVCQYVPEANVSDGLCESMEGTRNLVSLSQSHLTHTPKPAQEKESVSKQLFVSEPKVQSQKGQQALQADHKLKKIRSVDTLQVPWECPLSHLLCAYRGVLQKLVGFFPLELLHGRSGCGPREVTRAQCEMETGKGMCGVDMAVLWLRDKGQAFLGEVCEHMRATPFMEIQSYEKMSV
ncbi:uncharacterized protein LOC134571237 [Pelobates fuscus]|uniref:uncharacterized protein LOC134571237 n=1 Tax=Pelobates fuscus TaxID=191477 RepID=UPI002FE4C205